MQRAEVINAAINFYVHLRCNVSRRYRQYCRITSSAQIIRSYWKRQSPAANRRTTGPYKFFPPSSVDILSTRSMTTVPGFCLCDYAIPRRRIDSQFEPTSTAGATGTANSGYFKPDTG